MRDQEQPQEFNLRIPTTTILKLVFSAIIVVSIIKLWPFVLMLVTAILLAVALEPLVSWLEKHHVRQSIAVILIGLTMVAVLAGFVGIVVPATAKQTSEIFRNFSQAQSQMQRSAPSQTPWVRALITRLLAMKEAPQKSSIKAPLMFSLNAVEGVTAFLFVLVLTLYLLLDGKRLYAWLVSYVPPRHRDKLVRTTPDVKRVVAAYIRGQAITCFICGFYVFGVLTALRIPASVPLALLAFVADLLPVVGTILMTLPAVLLALTVSPVRAGIVLVAYLFYHLVESYVIIPRVYGHQMRLSTLTVLLAVAIGGYLQGAAGAVLILPFVALFPAVERIWLRDYLPEEAPQEHERLDRAEDDRSKVDRIADEIIEKTDGQ